MVKMTIFQWKGILVAPKWMIINNIKYVNGKTYAKFNHDFVVDNIKCLLSSTDDPTIYMTFNFAPTFVKDFYKSGGFPEFCKKQIQKLELFDFTFLGRGARLLYFIFTKLGAFQIQKCVPNFRKAHFEN